MPLTLPLCPHLISSNFSPTKSILSLNLGLYFFLLIPQVSFPPSHSNSCPLSSCSEPEGVSNSSTSRSELPSEEEGAEWEEEASLSPGFFVKISCKSGAQRRLRMARWPHRAKVLGVPGMGGDETRVDRHVCWLGFLCIEVIIWGKF